MKYLPVTLLFSLTILVPQAQLRAESAADAIHQDAAELAKIKGISVAEAVGRIVVQNKLNSDLQSLGENSGLVSANIESTSSTFKIHLWVTPNGITKMLSSSLVVDPAISDLIEVDTAPFTMAQLDSARNALFKALGNQEAATRIDARTGKLVLQVRDPNLANSLISELGLGDRVMVERRDKFPRPTDGLLGGYLGGGLPMVRPDGASCTTGFEVSNGGVPSLLTAGHCVLDAMNGNYVTRTVTVEGHDMSVDDAMWFAGLDYAWLSTVGRSFVNKIYIGTAGTRTITSAFYSTYQNRVAVGTLLCKYGKTTNYTCQEVVNNNYYAKDSSGNNVGPLVELGGTATDISQCGDSGGPVFSGPMAYGIVSRGDAEGKCKGGSVLLYTPLASGTVTVVTS